MTIKKEKLYEILKDEELSDKISQNISTTSRLRTLLYNLRRFPSLKQKLLDGDISPEYFAKEMTHEEMLPRLQEEKLIQINDDRDGLVKCNRCDSMKTEYTEVHSLEYTSFLVYCKNCNYTSKI